MKKGLKTAIVIILCVVVLSAYPIYAVIVWNISKSPDDIDEFPKNGIWVCKTENFVMTIDLSDLGEEKSPVEGMKATIEFGGKTLVLEHYRTNGHGTPLAPSAPVDILCFESIGSGEDDPDSVRFCTSKYRFYENDFYLLEISVMRGNKATFIKEKTDLHFVKQAHQAQ